MVQLSKRWRSGSVLAAFGAGIALASYGHHDIIGVALGMLGVVGGSAIRSIKSGTRHQPQRDGENTTPA